MSSLRKIRRDQCEGKVRYEDLTTAVKALIRVKKSELHPYKCKFCKGWHVGHRQRLARFQ